jgi:hypothetical protein
MGARAGFQAESEEELSVGTSEEVTVHPTLTLCGIQCAAGARAGFQAESEEELSVAPGEEVTVHAEVEGWLQVTRARDGVRGLVPASYVGGAGG